MTESTKTREAVIKVTEIKGPDRGEGAGQRRKTGDNHGIEKMAVVIMEATVVKTKRTKQSGQGQDRDKAGARAKLRSGAVSLEKQKLRKREERKEKKSGRGGTGSREVGRHGDRRAGPSQGGGHQRKKSGQCDQHRQWSSEHSWVWVPSKTYGSSPEAPRTQDTESLL